MSPAQPSSTTPFQRKPIFKLARNSLALQLFQALIQIVQHLQAKHGKLLHGKQELFPIHLQQLRIADGGGQPLACVGPGCGPRR